MDELRKINLMLALLPAMTVGVVISLLLLVVNSSGGDTTTIMEIGSFQVPFPTGTQYTITSPYGNRIDPFDETGTNIVFHTGIDLSAYNSDIVATADGYVVEVGYAEEGLGHYVYLEHQINGQVFYSAYGHMLENSIVVSVGQKVTLKQKLGVIGNSGASTGTHLHFGLAVGTINFHSQEFLMDPSSIFK